MRARAIRSLVSALGERGNISLPLIPQLMPVVSITDMRGIGFPIGLPVAIRIQQAAVAAERGGCIFLAPEGYVIRIDRVVENTNVYNLIYANVSAGFSGSTESWVVTDPRVSTVAAVSLLKGGAAQSTTLANWLTAITGPEIVSNRPAGLITDLGNVYVTDRFGLWGYGGVDNTATKFTAFGEAFEIG